MAMTADNFVKEIEGMTVLEKVVRRELQGWV